MNRIAISTLTSEAFAPFGEVGAPLADGGHAPGDVALDLSRGIPRFYIMRLAQRGLVFDVIARHDCVTQCLGAVDGKPWLIAVTPANLAQPGLAEIRAFCIPPGCFIKLGLGTRHAGPYVRGITESLFLEQTNILLPDLRGFAEPELEPCAATMFSPVAAGFER